MSKKEENPLVGVYCYIKSVTFGVDSTDLYADSLCYFNEDGTVDFDEYNTGTYEIIDDKTIKLNLGHFGEADKSSDFLVNYAIDGDTLTLTEGATITILARTE